MKTFRIARALAAVLPLAIAACADQAEDPLAPNAAPALAAAPAHAARDEEHGHKPDTIFNRYIVQFRDGVGRPPRELADELVGRHGGIRTHVYRRVIKGFAAVNLPPQAVEALRRNPNVLRVEEEKPVRHHAQTQFLGGDFTMWGLDRMDQATGLDGQFRFQFTGAGVHVYILDTGIRGDHQEFAGRLGNSVNKIWYDWSSPFQDDHGHGTKAAGAAAGSTLGVARGATVHSVKINTGGSAWPNDIIAGLDWVAENAIKPAVANLSYETGPIIDTAMDNLINSGVVLVKSAGNDNEEACDADAGNRVDRAIIVGATNRGDSKASFSNWGPCIDVWAPGESVRSADRDHATDQAVVSGTSFAAPYVAGVVATMLEQEPLNSFTAMMRVRATATRDVLSNLGAGSSNLLANSMHQYVTINGATEIASGSTAFTRTWSATTRGGDGAWSFLWEVSVAGGPYTVVSYGSSYTRTINPYDNYGMNVRVSATSGGRTVTSTRYVKVTAPNPDGELPECPNWKMCEVQGY